MNLFDKIEKNEIIEACKRADSKSQMARLLGINHYNGTVGRWINKTIEEYDLDVSHFDGGRKRSFKYERIERICPVCKNKFKTQKGGKAEKKTCSYACANTLFRSGENNGMYMTGNSYRTVCFHYHDKRCIICGEENIVSVHHYDGNHENNDPKNLVPLCPTHHQYWHSKHKHLIEEQVEEFIASIV